MTFRPIARPRNLSLDTAAAIQEAIEGGRYAIGDRLPSEARLAEAMGVSRGIVREAIARLRAAGMVESVQGSGAYVRRAEPVPEFRIEPEQVLHAAELQGVFELRLELEVLAVGLAATRRRRRDLTALRAQLDRMARDVDAPERAMDPDYTLHVLIAGASGNAWLRDLLAYVTRQVSDSVAVRRRQAPPDRAVLARVQEEHAAIVRAIADQDPAEAGRLARRHLMGAAERLGLDTARLGRPA